MGVCCWGTGDPLRASAVCTSMSFTCMNREGSSDSGSSKGCWQVEQRWGASQETADETETASASDSFLLSAGDDMASRRTATGEQANGDRRAGERQPASRRTANGRTASRRTGEQANGERRTANGERAGEQANRTAGERRRVKRRVYTAYESSGE